MRTIIFIHTLLLFYTNLCFQTSKKINQIKTASQNTGSLHHKHNHYRKRAPLCQLTQRFPGFVPLLLTLEPNRLILLPLGHVFGIH